MPVLNSSGRFYEPKEGSTRLTVIRDRSEFTQADDLERLSVITDLQNATQAVREYIAGGPGALGEFDAKLETEEQELRDRLDYYDYSNEQIQITVKDGAWFTPEAVESVSDEKVGNEAVLAIDGDNQTYWQSDNAGTRTIIFRLRHYRKKVEKIRFRTNTSDGRSHLQGVTIRMSGGLGQIDNPQNEIATGLNLDGAASWFEHTLASPKSNVRYIKIECATSMHTNPDQLRIRELAAWVTTRRTSDNG